MGVSETFGCGFAMLGGYVGEELKARGGSCFDLGERQAARAARGRVGRVSQVLEVESD